MASNPNEVLSKNQARKGAEGQNETNEAGSQEKKGGPSRFRTMKGLIAGLAVVAALTGVGVSACSEDNSNPPEIPSDGGPIDSGPDSDTDSDADTSTDTGTDSDTTTDSGTDSDTTTDSGTDTDTTTDSGTDTDTGPALCEEGLDAEPETFSGIVYTGVPQAVSGYVFELTGTSGINAIFSISCGGVPVEGGPFNCQIGKDTEITTAEGRTITISPGASGPGGTNCTISVE